MPAGVLSTVTVAFREITQRLCQLVSTCVKEHVVVNNHICSYCAMSLSVSMTSANCGVIVICAQCHIKKSFSILLQDGEKFSDICIDTQPILAWPDSLAQRGLCIHVDVGMYIQSEASASLNTESTLGIHHK